MNGPLKECPVQDQLLAALVCLGGKASQEDSDRLDASHLCQKPLLYHHQCVSAAVCVCARGSARRHLRLRRLFSRHLPPAIKPFPTIVSSSVTKTASANIIRPPSIMARAILLGEFQVLCHQNTKWWHLSNCPESVSYS